jgi:hypothetical protein
MRINEELLERKVAAPVLKTEINDRKGIWRPDHQQMAVAKSV